MGSCPDTDIDPTKLRIYRSCVLSTLLYLWLGMLANCGARLFKSRVFPHSYPQKNSENLPALENIP